MDEEEYQLGLESLRQQWGELIVDPKQPGILHASREPLTGILVGVRAPLIAEIINRALGAANANS